MKVAVVGSRDFPNREMVQRFVDMLPSDTCVVSGGARGVDRWAVYAARDRGLDIQIFPAEWDKYGKSAGFRRNHDIVDMADWVAAFWDGQSRGTAHDIGLCKELGKPCCVYLPISDDHFVPHLFAVGVRKDLAKIDELLRQE